MKDAHHERHLLVEQALEALHARLRKELTRLDLPVKPYLLPEMLPAAAQGTVRVAAQGFRDELRCNFLFVDEDRRLLGYFKAYSEAGWEQELAQDMHRVALLRGEQALSVLMAPERPTASLDRQRPWTPYLFCLVPGTQKPAPIWGELRQERVAQEVGLCRLDCTAGVLAAIRSPGSGREDADEVRRFLAPLLLQTRSLATRDLTWIDQWRNDLWEELFGEARLADLASRFGTAEAGRLEKQVSSHRPTMAPPLPFRLHQLNRLRFRRFGSHQPTLPFGRVTVLYGTNGSGKSSLLEALELALTGKIRRLGAPSDPKDAAELNRVVAPKREGMPEGDLHTVVMPGTDGQEPTRRSVAFRDGVPDLPLDSFYLRQEDLQKVMGLSARDLYTWMASVLGVQVAGLDQALEEFQSAARAEANTRLQALFGDDVPPGQEDWTRAFTERALQELSTIEQPFLWMIDASLNWERLPQNYKTRIQWGGVVTEMGELGRLFLFHDSSAFLARKLKGEADWRNRPAGTEVPVLRNHIREYRKMKSRLENAAGQLRKLLAPVSAVIETAKGRLIPRDYTRMLDNLMEVNHIKQLEERLQRAVDAMTSLEAVMEQLETAKRLGEEVRKLEAGSKNRRLRSIPSWDALPEDMEERFGSIQRLLTEFQAPAAQLASLAPRVNEQLKFAREAHTLAESHLRDLEKETEALRNQMLGAGIQVEIETRWKEALGPLAAFARKVGLGPIDLKNTEEIQRLVDTYDNCNEVLYYLNLILTEAPRFDAWLAFLDEIERWDTASEKLTECGIPSLLRQVDMVYEYQNFCWRTLTERIRALVEGDVQNVWQELIWTLTAHNWYQPSATMAVAKDSEHNSVHMKTDLGPADVILNMAEKNILGLAWFLVTYLLVGRRHSQALIIDDPFQHMDDVNLATFIRVFEGCLWVLGAHQVVLAIHQPSIREYLEQTLGGPELSPGRHAFSDLLVVWLAEPVGRYESQITPIHRGYRDRPVRVSPFVNGEPTPLPVY